MNNILHEVIKEIEKLENNATEKKLFDFIEKLKREPIYIWAISIDLTTLNSLFGYSVADKIKNIVIFSLREFYNRKRHMFLQLGSKLIYLMDFPMDSRIKAILDNEINRFLNNDKEVNVIYFEQIRLPRIEFDELKIKALFLKLSEYEKNLSKTRGIIQRILHGEEFMLEHLDYNALIDINYTSQKTIEKKLKKFNFSSIRHSKYLSLAYQFIFGKNTNLEKNVALEYGYRYLLLYLFWISLQRVLFNLEKKEKLKRALYKQDIKHYEKFKIENIDEIKKWYSSVIEPYIVYMDNKTKELALKIREKIQKGNLDKELFLIMEEFIDNFDIHGVFNVPFNSIKLSQESKRFFSRQMYLLFRDQAKEKFKELRKYISGKQRLSIVTDKFEELLIIISFLNNSSYLQNLKKFAIVFFEIDGFNAFNRFIFPNDHDKVYELIINALFESANELIIKFPKELSSLAFMIKGDEFFVVGRYNNLNAIDHYIKKVRKKIINLFKSKKFIKTKKIKIVVDKHIVTYRMVEKDSENNPILAKLGLTTVMLYGIDNEKLLKKIENTYLVNTKIFRYYLEKTENILTNIKNSKKKGEYIMFGV